VHRISEIIGKTVVSAESGDRLGSVSDALVEEGHGRVVGLVLGSGVFVKEHVMPFHNVQALGGDAVLARTDAGIVAPAAWRKSGVRATRSSDLRGRAVVTASGERIGHVSDLLVDEQTGAFGGLEVSWGHRLVGMRSRHSVVRASEQIRIGPHVVVVPNDALEKELDPDAA
jgi:uncharacterized protein YrrD